MHQRQGSRLSQAEVAKIQRLLAETDMTIDEIVERMGRSKAVILSINRKFAIRIYTGRSHWAVNKNRSTTTPNVA